MRNKTMSVTSASMAVAMSDNKKFLFIYSTQYSEPRMVSLVCNNRTDQYMMFDTGTMDVIKDNYRDIQPKEMADLLIEYTKKLGKKEVSLTITDLDTGKSMEA